MEYVAFVERLLSSVKVFYACIKFNIALRIGSDKNETVNTDYGTTKSDLKYIKANILNLYSERLC